MLREFIDANRIELLARTRAKVAARPAPRATLDELKNGVPLFLNQLVEALRLASPSAATVAAIGRSATVHGREMLKLGFTVSQVVRGYGDVCQVVTELACETDASSGILAREMRTRVSAAILALSALKSGRSPINGSVGAVLARNLRRLGALIDRSLLESRVDSGQEHRQHVAVRQLVEEAEAEGALQADAHNLALTVSPVDRGIYVDVDPQIVSGVVANLLDNAFKFTRKGGHVSLNTSATPTRVLIDVEDECGGLPSGKVEELFHAFEQHGAARTGLGLGLFISRKGVEASGGMMRVGDVPGAGCDFTIDLPRLAVA